MAPSRAFKRFGAPLASRTEPSDPLDEFPRELPFQKESSDPGTFQQAPVDPLDEFPREVPFHKEQADPFRDLLSEHRSKPWPAEIDTTPKRPRSYRAAAVGVGIFTAIVVVARYVPASTRPVDAPAPVVISESTVTFTSAPDGAGVYIDGVHAGETPISLSLPVGQHAAEIRSGTTSRRTSLSVEAGKILTQHMDFAAVPATGGLQVTSDPTGAQVSIDGTRRGLTPLKIPEIAPGEHRVTISSGQTSVNRTIEVTAGATATVVVSVPVIASTGSVEIVAPVDLEVFEAGRRLGSGRVSRISLPPGPHRLEFVSRPLGFRTETTVNVVTGQSVSFNVPMPNGRLSINALPWAEVWVDGRAVGQTPIGNLSVPYGRHEVLWRHPEHGERRQSVLVSTEPVRVGFDWTR